MLTVLILCVLWAACGLASYGLTQYSWWDGLFDEWPWWAHIVGGPFALILTLSY